MPAHVVLLGDSTLDNAAYTEGGPDVVSHLRSLLTPGEAATLLARDGAVVRDVPGQLDALRSLLRDPGDGLPPTHVLLSVGGNDLLGETDVLTARCSTVGEALMAVADRAERFGAAYRGLVDEVLRLGLPTAICTVYDGAFDDPMEARVIETALRIFDQEIVRVGLDRGLPVVDLRRVCSEPEDYWNPIEPSERGGEKIARAILAALRVPRYDLAGPAVTVQGTGGMP